MVGIPLLHLQMRHFDEDLVAETRERVVGAFVSGLVVEHEGHAPVWADCIHNKRFLLVCHGAAHDGNDVFSACLIESHHIKESFADNETLFLSYSFCAVQVVDDIRLAELRREFILPFPLGRVTPRPAAGVSDELAVFVVDDL
jgi:hypothetical protein